MTIEERAWFLISRSVSGDISPGEANELELIFLDHPELRSDYENIERLKLNMIGNPSIEERRALERGMEKLEHSLENEDRFMERHIFNNHGLKPINRNNSKWWMAAASVIVLAMAGLFVQHFKTPVTNTQQEIATHYGKRIHTTLPDGSTVWLNSGSTIKYAQNLLVDGKREVTLIGEAYFDVKHDAKHPFIVHAGKLNVVVLGTAFDVKAYAGDAFMEATLIRGKVEILNDDKPGTNIILYPNEKVTVSTVADVTQKTKLAVKDITVDSLANVSYKAALPQLPNEAITETAWVSDKLTFKKENFTDLAKQLERWYNVEIAFDNNNYNSKQFTGAFKDQDINEVMRDLQFTESFHYSINNNKIHIW